MQKTKKRKLVRLESATDPPETTTGATTNGPFPDYPHPTPEECQAVRDDLLALHGFPQQFVKYRNQRLQNGNNSRSILRKHDPSNYEQKDGILNDDSKESVLDGLVSTILSQNTTDVNSQKAFASLKSAFPTWEDVLAADPKSIEDVIRCGGLAPTKTSCIKNVLSCLVKRKGKLCLEYLRGLSVEQIKDELYQFKGIGPKTVACVLMFHLQHDDFPVDTHIFQIAKTIGWIPAAADMKKAYLHLNQKIPNDLKFDLNCLLFSHGKVCQKCSSKKIDKQKKDINANPCPLLMYCRHLQLDVNGK